MFITCLYRKLEKLGEKENLEYAAWKEGDEDPLVTRHSCFVLKKKDQLK